MTRQAYGGILRNVAWCVQGGSFAYLTPTFAIIAQIKSRQDWQDAPDGTNHERFLVRHLCIKMINSDFNRSLNLQYRDSVCRGSCMIMCC